MGILAKFKNRERERIDELFIRVDKLSEGQVDELIKVVFTTWINQGFIAQGLVNMLAGKIALVVGFPVDISRDGFENWYSAFKSAEIEKKRALLVTVANDVAKLGVFSERDIYLKIDEFLKDVSGFLAGSREFDNAAKTSTQTKGD